MLFIIIIITITNNTNIHNYSISCFEFVKALWNKCTTIFPLNSRMCKVVAFMLTLSVKAVKVITHFQKPSYCCSEISVNTVLLKSLHKYAVMSSVRSGWLSRWRERGFILFKQILFHRIQMSLSAVRSPCAHSKIHKKCIQTFIHNGMPLLRLKSCHGSLDSVSGVN